MERSAIRDRRSRISLTLHAGYLPIQQPTKCDLFVNLKTAKAIGITVSTSVLLRAEGVIE